MKKKRLLLAVCLLLISATMLGTASFAWFSMNTDVTVEGIQVEAYSDSLFLEISRDGVDTNYHTAVNLSSNGEKVLRLAKHGFVDKLYNITVTQGNGNYTGSGTYYKLVKETVDSNKKYVLAAAGAGLDLELGTSLNGLYKDLEFTRITTDVKSDGTTTYYKMDAGKYVVAADRTLDVSVKGYYTLTTEPVTAETGGNYNGTGEYYLKADDGSYADVTSTLNKGTDLADFWIITNPTEVTDFTKAKGELYIANGNEYSFYAKYDAETDISADKDALYFGRAYSDVIDDGDKDDTLSIIKDEKLNSYRYTDTLYLRNATNTNNSENLQVDFTVGGVVNELSDSLRVLLVCSINGVRVNTVLYENRSKTTTYGTGSNIVEVLLGNREEVLKVDVYVYFDGTDADANNKNVPAGTLDGQTVDLKFTIDGPDYNEPAV